MNPQENRKPLKNHLTPETSHISYDGLNVKHDVDKITETRHKKSREEEKKYQTGLVNIPNLKSKIFWTFSNEIIIYF